MISNIKPYCSCYRQYCNANVYFYVEVKNNCSDYTHMLLQYEINGKIVTKPSPTFAPGKTKRIIFPDNASNLQLTILDSSFEPPELICAKLLLPHRISRYVVIGSHYSNFQCISI